MTTMVSAIHGSRSSRLSRVVLPAPRKPVTTLSGIGAGRPGCAAVMKGGPAWLAGHRRCRRSRHALHSTGPAPAIMFYYYICRARDKRKAGEGCGGSSASVERTGPAGCRPVLRAPVAAHLPGRRVLLHALLRRRLRLDGGPWRWPHGPLQHHRPAAAECRAPGLLWREGAGGGRRRGDGSWGGLGAG